LRLCVKPYERSEYKERREHFKTRHLLKITDLFITTLSFIFSVMEKLIANTSLHDLLDGITAAVVGLIGITALRLIIENIQSPSSIITFLVAIVSLIKFRSKYIPILIITGAGLIGFITHFII